MSILKVNTIQDKGGNNLLVSDGAGTISSGGAITNTPAFHVVLSGDFSVSNNTATKVDYATATIDTDSAFDLSNNKYVIPSGKSGRYYLQASGAWNSATDFDNSESQIRLNGNTISAARLRNEYYDVMKTSIVVDLSVGDYLEHFIYQSSGGTISWRGDTNESFFEGYKLIGA